MAHNDRDLLLIRYLVFLVGVGKINFAADVLFRPTCKFARRPGTSWIYFFTQQKKTENTVEFFFENKFIKTISSTYIYYFAFNKISGTIKIKTTVFRFYWL